MTASLNKSPSSRSAILNHSRVKTISNFVVLLGDQRQCDEIVLLYCLIVREDQGEALEQKELPRKTFWPTREE